MIWNIYVRVFGYQNGDLIPFAFSECDCDDDDDDDDCDCKFC